MGAVGGSIEPSAKIVTVPSGAFPLGTNIENAETTISDAIPRICAIFFFDSKSSHSLYDSLLIKRSAASSIHGALVL
jgi:hypothetical protein